MRIFETSEELIQCIEELKEIEFQFMRWNARLVTEEMKYGLSKKQKMELLKLEIIQTGPHGLFVRLPE